MMRGLNLDQIYYPPTALCQTKIHQVDIRGTHLALHVLCVIFAIDVACGGLVLYSKSCVSDLGGQTVFEVKETRLTDVFDFGAGLANDGGFESCAGARIPSKDSKRTGASTTGSTILLF